MGGFSIHHQNSHRQLKYIYIFSVSRENDTKAVGPPRSVCDANVDVVTRGYIVTLYPGLEPLEYSGCQLEYSCCQLEYSGCQLEYSGCQLEYNGCQMEYSGSQLEYSGCLLEYSGCQLEYSGTELRCRGIG